MRKHGEGSVYRRADGRYVASVRYTDDKGAKRRATVYGKTEREARQRLREMLRRVEDGGAVVDSGITLAEWCERWLTVTLPASNRRRTTQQTYSALVRTHVIPNLGRHRLRDLTPAHVEGWVVELGAKRSPSTVRQAHGLLVVILDAAVRHELIRRNVAKAVDRPAKPRTEATHYTSDEVALLRRMSAGDRLEPFLTLTAFTGLRKGEVLALRWSDVDVEGERPSLRVTGTLSRIGGSLVRTEPKTAAGRRSVPLVPVAVEALKDARRAQTRERLAAGPAWSDSDYVFTTEVGTPVDPRNALRWFYGVRERARRELMATDDRCSHDPELVKGGKACPRCGRQPSDYLGGALHTFRHSAATVLLSSGVPMPMVKDVLGHSSISVTVDMYGHLAPSVIADAMSASLAGYGQARGSG